jgi:RimJ/RimL family protein N-acetyltransferase
MLTSKQDLLAPSTVQARNERFFAQENAIPMQVIRHGGPEGKLVGCVSLTPRVGKEVVDLGYYLNPAHHGKGIMTTAAVAALRWARDEFGVRTVYSRYVLIMYGDTGVIIWVALKCV